MSHNPDILETQSKGKGSRSQEYLTFAPEKINTTHSIPSPVSRDLKHHDGRHDDGIPEVYFPFRSCAEPEKLIAIRRRPVVGDATFTVLT